MRDAKNSEMKKMLAGTIALLVVVASVGVYQKWFSKTSKFDEDHIGECYYQEIQEEHVATDDLTMYTDNEILLVTEDGVKKRAVEKLAKKYDAEIVGRIEQTGDYQLQLSNVYSLEELEQLSEDLKAEDIVASADINYIFDAEPSDVESSSESFQYGKEWAGDLANSTDCAGKSWGFEMIQAPAAWELLKEHSDQVNQDLRIGLIDNGFDDNHEDLGFAETFYNQNISEDNKKHGTHVAGIMAAKSDNEAGICGVYPFGDGHLYGVSFKGVSKYSENTVSVMQEKCSYSELILRNVKIINCSYGPDEISTLAIVYNDANAIQKMENKSTCLAEFFQRLLDKGYDFCIVQAAGNGSNTSYTRAKCVNGQLQYDANGEYAIVTGKNKKSYNMLYRVNGKWQDFKVPKWEEKNIKYVKDMDAKDYSLLSKIKKSDFPDIYDRIIVVGAVDRDKKRSSYSNCNLSSENGRVDIYAPGGDTDSTNNKIFSLQPKNVYNDMDNNYMCGTSMAAPHVSGVAAMVWSANSSLTGAEVKDIVCNTNRDDSWDLNIVNAESAVERALNWESDGEETATEPQNGGILNFVVDKDDENTKIDHADVTAVKVNGECYTTTTDADGHFELFLPEGTYDVTVSRWDYCPYTWKDIEVRNNGVNYLSDWTKLEKRAEWKVEPTIEAEDILVSDEYGNNIAYDQCSIIKQNGKYGIIQYDGSYIANPEYEDYFYDSVYEIAVSDPRVENSDTIKDTLVTPDDGELNISTDTVWGRVNITNKYIYDETSNQVYCITAPPDRANVYSKSIGTLVEDYRTDILGEYDEDNNSYAISRDITFFNETSPKYGIAKDGKLIVPCEYEDGCMNFSGGVTALKKDGKWGYFDQNGTQIIDFICEPFASKVLYGGWDKGKGTSANYPFLSSDYIPVKIDGKCGYYDTSGNEVIPCGTFEDVRPVHNHLAWVKKDGKWGVIELKELENQTITAVEKSESELHDLMEEKGTICAWECADYDGDGKKEAFAIIGTNNMPDYYVSDNIQGVYYINSVGEITELQRNNNPMCRIARSVFHKGKGFFAYDSTAGGSSSQLYLYGVKDGNCFELSISGTITDFYQKDGTCFAVAKTALSSGGYDWLEYELSYDESTQEFTLPKEAVGQATQQTEETTEQSVSSNIPDSYFLAVVNRYLREHDGELDSWLDGLEPYCSSEYSASNETRWSCPINTNRQIYSREQIAGAYPLFAYVDKTTMKGVISVNYKTVAEFDIPAYQSNSTDISTDTNSYIDTYYGSIEKDGHVYSYKMSYHTAYDGSGYFKVIGAVPDGIGGEFELPVTKIEDDVYYYENGSCFNRGANGSRINAASGLSGTVTIQNYGTWIWKIDDFFPYELVLELLQS